MAETLQTLIDRRNLLDNYVTTFSLFIKELCPEGQLEISFARYEDEDAHIHVFLPSSIAEEKVENLGNQFAEKSLDILLESGLLILVGIYEQNQMRKKRGKSVRP